MPRARAIRRLPAENVNTDLVLHDGARAPCFAVPAGAPPYLVARARVATVTEA